MNNFSFFFALLNRFILVIINKLKTKNEDCSLKLFKGKTFIF